MKRFVSKASVVNWTGSVAVFALVVAVGAAQAGQEQGRQGGVIQKGKSGLTEQTRPASGLAPGAVVGIVVARSEDQSACAGGAAPACRAIESGLSTGGAWAFVDGGVMGLDDWETQAASVSSVGALTASGGGAASASYARSSAPAPAPESSRDARGNHIPSAVIVHRALAACDGGDVRACSAFARTVRPATAAERSETRTYTAGR